MNVMTVVAHPNPRSFCHALLRPFDAGLKEAGHANDIVDLYAISFDPTHLTEETYGGEFGRAMTRIIDDWGLRDPGVKKVEHVYLYGADVSTAEMRRAWLDQAYRLGAGFAN